MTLVHPNRLGNDNFSCRCKKYSVETSRRTVRTKSARYRPNTFAASDNSGDVRQAKPASEKLSRVADVKRDSLTRRLMRSRRSRLQR